MGNFPQHGYIECNDCFEQGKKILKWKGNFHWRLDNATGSWGGRNPVVLVLGFSKGPKQLNTFYIDPFDDIPFKDMRQNLTKILHRLKVLPSHQKIGDRINSREKDFSFGSVIRCSIAVSKKENPCEEDWKRSGGAILSDCVSDDSSKKIIKRCADKFLSTLPSRLCLIILLGNDKKYVDGCFNIFRNIHPSLAISHSSTWKGKKHPVAYTDGKVTWCHVPHASCLASAHLKAWLGVERTLQASKREIAIQAVKESGVLRYLGVNS